MALIEKRRAGDLTEEWLKQLEEWNDDGDRDPNHFQDLIDEVRKLRADLERSRAACYAAMTRQQGGSIVQD